MRLAFRLGAGSAFLTSTLLLAACEGQTDPAKAGLFDNLNNLNRGEYNRQIAANEATAAQIVRDNQRSQASIGQLQSQKSANNATAGRLRGQISAARADLASARSRASGDPVKLARLSQLEKQISSVQQASTSGASEGVLSNELSSIRASIRAVSS
jgi:hypothetical protein